MCRKRPVRGGCPVMPAPTRPVLRYHGGKWMLAPWVISYFPVHKIYVEPCGGAASVLMRKPRSFAEVYNDLDGEVVNVFRVLRDPAAAADLERLLRLTPFAREEFNGSYEPSDDPIEQARRTVVRCFMGHGSTAQNPSQRTGFRFRTYSSNRTGPADWLNYPNALGAMSERLQGVLIENRPATRVIEEHDSADTLHYVDPPYVAAARYIGRPDSGGARGYRHEMTDDQHRELAAALQAAAGMVVISGYPCDLYDRELYAGWKRVSRGALADGARKRTEVLWLNPAAADQLAPTLFTGSAG